MLAVGPVTTCRAITAAAFPTPTGGTRAFENVVQDFDEVQAVEETQVRASAPSE